LYIGAGIGPSKLRTDLSGIDRNDNGGKIFGGYEFSPNFALELGYADFGKFGFTGGSLEANGIYVDAVGKFPFAANWSGLARIGVFDGKVEGNTPLFTVDDRGTSFKVGLGVQFDLTKNAAITGEWERYRFDVLDNDDVDLLTVGFKYRF
jgi:OmpA-OmpF porin, OOP family